MNSLSAKLAEIKERLAKATPGPWLIRSHAGYSGLTYNQVTRDGRNDCIQVFRTNEPQLLANAHFIAHAPTDIARLVLALERADAALAEYAKEYVVLGVALSQGPLRAENARAELVSILEGTDE